MEEAELKEFEQLEQAAHEISLLSQSSFLSHTRGGHDSRAAVTSSPLPGMGGGARSGDVGERPLSALGTAPNLAGAGLSPDRTNGLEQPGDDSRTPVVRSPSKSPVSNSESDDTLREPDARMNFDDDKTWDSLSMASSDEHLQSVTPSTRNTPTPTSDVFPEQGGKHRSATPNNGGHAWLTPTCSSANVLTSQDRPPHTSSWAPVEPSRPAVTHQPHPSSYPGGTTQSLEAFIPNFCFFFLQ